MTKTTGMNFIEAVKAAMEGHRVTRKHCTTFVYADTMYDLMISDGKEPRKYVLHNFDVIAEDWEIIPRAYSFTEMLGLLGQGKRMKRKEWKNCIYSDRETVRWSTRNNDDYVLYLSDIQADDWIVVDEEIDATICKQTKGKLE